MPLLISYNHRPRLPVPPATSFRKPTTSLTVPPSPTTLAPRTTSQRRRPIRTIDIETRCLNDPSLSLPHGARSRRHHQGATSRPLTQPKQSCSSTLPRSTQPNRRSGGRRRGERDFREDSNRGIIIHSKASNFSVTNKNVSTEAYDIHGWTSTGPTRKLLEIWDDTEALASIWA